MKKEDFVGFDLCMLASSDHTLITYGSFGLWGAILSPGDVIAAKGTNNLTYSVVTIKAITTYAYSTLQGAPKIVVDINKIFAGTFILNIGYISLFFYF